MHASPDPVADVTSKVSAEVSTKAADAAAFVNPGEPTYGEPAAAQRRCIG
jgi:hypothetical protein